MTRPVLSVIIGSTRPGRIGPAIAAWFAELAERDGRFDVEIVDLAEVALPLFDEPYHPRLRRYVHDHTFRWSEIVDRADAVVLVNPEYNHSVNAALKNALDYLSAEWAHKPVSFVSYGGASGGARAVQVLKQIVSALRMYPIGNAVALPFAGSQLDPAGIFQPTETQIAAATATLDELATLTAVVRPLRVPATAAN